MSHPVHTLEQTGDTRVERSGNSAFLAIKCDGSKINTDDLDPREDYPKHEPVEQTKKIEISRKGRITQIRTLLNGDQKEEMTRFLKEN